MAIQVRKAERKKARLRLGIAAPSGAGKTMGALLVAYGLTGNWGRVGLADTESGSGELYVGHSVPGSTTVIGDYLYCRIDPPYTIPKYIEAQKALEAAGCEVVILDSTSHAWAGAGGLLDKQSKIAAKSGNSYTAWRDVTPEHNLFVETMLNSPVHIIATMRSKTEYIMDTNDRGKQAPRKVGMAPIQREGMDFEMSIMLDIDANHVASATKDRTSLLDGEFFKLSPEIGKRLLAWLNTGRDAEPIAPPPPSASSPPPATAPRQTIAEFLDALDAELAAAPDEAAVGDILARSRVQQAQGALKNGALERLVAMIQAAIARTSPPADDDPLDLVADGDRKAAVLAA